MNIAFDAAAILGPMSKNRGIGNYALSQFREMISRDKDNQYFFFNIFEPFSIGEFPNLQESYFYCGRELDLLSIADGKLYGTLVRKFIHKNKINVFYITSPFESQVPVYQEAWFCNVKTVVTVYDIIPLVFKNHYFPNGDSDMEWYVKRLSVLNWVDKMIVISQSVKDDLIKYLNFSGDNIDVIWGAPSALFQEITVGENDANKLKKKYGLNNQFIMCTGGDDERKNIAGLIKAYGLTSLEFREQYDLVIVCKLQKKSEQRYTALAKKMGLSKKVIFTNFVSDEELLQLYNMAALVAFPSKYEGFGLPVVEAWACGKAVLTSDNSSLIQIAGDAAVIVNPECIEDISRGLQEAMQVDTLKQMAERGRDRLKLFQWPVVADRAIESIRQLITPEIKIHTELPKLAYFSPLPPIQSGISDYSVDIINELAHFFQIDVFIDDDYKPVCNLPSNTKVYNHKMFPKMEKRYSYKLYQMGNSLFHCYMYSYLEQYGGVLVLHDYNMHGVLQAVAFHVVNDNLKTYRDCLIKDYSESRVDEYLQQIRSGGSVKTDMEVNGFVTNYANKIIVHSNYAGEKLLRKNIGSQVCMIPHYANISPLADVADAKKKCCIDPDTTVFATFGFIHETKRAIPLLRAGIRLLKEYKNAMLLFVGKLDQTISDSFHHILSESGVSDRILVTGYVDLEQFCNYIDAADVCFNLRHPYNGENSGSLARIVARGKCVVVNDIGSFSEIPDDCCVKIPPVEKMQQGQEENLIYQVMKDIMRNHDFRKTTSERARKYAEKTLSIQTVAEQYADFIISEGGNDITEEFLHIIRQDIIQKKVYEDVEIREISKTLAYCVATY